MHLCRSSDSVAAPSQQRCAHDERSTGHWAEQPLGKICHLLGQKQGGITIKPCFFKINLPKELRSCYIHNIFLFMYVVGARIIHRICIIYIHTHARRGDSVPCPGSTDYCSTRKCTYAFAWLESGVGRRRIIRTATTCLRRLLPSRRPPTSEERGINNISYWTLDE